MRQHTSSIHRQRQTHPFPSHRSQRDTRGEQEQRLQQLKELQEQVQKLEDRMRTAANDRRQFEHALTKSQQDINENQ